LFHMLVFYNMGSEGLYGKHCEFSTFKEVWSDI
jgi:hypothetical protein